MSQHFYNTRSKSKEYHTSATTSCAAQLHPGSESVNSKTLAILQDKMIQLHSQPDPWGTEREHYSLNEVLMYLGLDLDHLTLEIKREVKKSDPKLINDHLVGKCLKHISTIVGIDCDIYINNEVNGMSELPILGTSTRVRPDVLVAIRNCHKYVVGWAGEVLSSPMKETEFKAVYLGIDLLRLARCANEGLDCISVFVFPKLAVKRFIGKIDIEFDGLIFNCKLKIYSELSAAIDSIKDSLHCTRHHIVPVVPKYLIKLNSQNLRHLCDKLMLGEGDVEVKQYQSASHIVLCLPQDVLKIIYHTDLGVFINLKTKFEECGVTIVPEYNLVTLSNSTVVFAVKYQRVKYDPLSTTESKSCLRMLILEVSEALQRMHQSGIAHNDIRLPNICFNDLYKPVFIDIDRATKLDIRYANVSGMGCMYDDIDGDSATVDMVQLGWMVAWILASPADASTYHTRKWDSQPNIVKNDKFVEKLIKKGIYSAADLPAGYGSNSIQSVLSKRTM
jgi:hypothetical protein